MVVLCLDSTGPEEVAHAPYEVAEHCLRELDLLWGESLFGQVECGLESSVERRDMVLQEGSEFST